MKSKRIIDLGAMTTKVAIREIENLALKLFLSEEGKRKKDLRTQEQIAEIVFSKLSQLKGTGLKLLQALSLDEELVPKPYIDKFEAAYGKVSPLSRPVVKKVFKSEIGKTPEEAFVDFNYSPFAAASLGQVHEAKLQSGKIVVVKVQYPNVAENMQTDLMIIKTIASAIGNPLMKNSIKELSKNLIAETDYRLEAENLRLFQSLDLNETILIPKVYSDLSTSKVLTMSKVNGQPLHTAKSQELKNVTLQRVFNLFFYSLKTGSCIHADPHPGNFLVNELSTGVVDFGSVKTGISPEVKTLFLRLMDPTTSVEELVRLYGDLGADLSKINQQFYDDHVKEYHELCTLLIGQNIVDFGSSQKVVSRMRRSLFFQSREPELQGLSSEFTLLHKAFQSMLFMFCKFQAKIDTRITTNIKG